MMRSFTICTAHQIFFGDEVKRKEMGRACGTYKRRERCMQGLGGGYLRERSTWYT